MESYFRKFREQIIGDDIHFQTPYGEKQMLYADWIASGRLYRPIEDRISNLIGPYVGNTHTETTITGTLMTKAYHAAHQNIKKHVHAGPNDVIITYGNGMTSVVNKFQRILGLKICGQLTHANCRFKSQRPVVFITHMEHHSNHTSWLETMVDVVMLKPNKNLLVDLNELQKQLKKYKDRKLKIGAFTACSNVTGIQPPYHAMAALMHEHGGLCFVDFAASAPYVDMNMHPADPMQKLDAIFFSPHKFLGGPGTSGVMIFDASLYDCEVPDQPGGGTVDWTNPWGEYKYIDNIELREDGGTPGFLQAIRTALCIELKNKMGTKNIHQRETRLVELAFSELEQVPALHILADQNRNRLGVFSVYFEDIHYNLVVKLLNDRFGIQVRGGCACAGTYGHFLLDVSYAKSKKITDLISSGDLSLKPGWVRISLHPTTTDDEVRYIGDALRQIRKNHQKWSKDYLYNRHTNEFIHRKAGMSEDQTVNSWLKF